MRGFQPDNARKGKAVPTAATRGFSPLKQGAALAQAQNQAPDSIPGLFKPGEFVLPPDTVHALGGAQALQATVDATHTPSGAAPQVPQGFEPEVFFDAGGDVEEQRRRQSMNSPSNTYPGNRTQGTSGSSGAPIARAAAAAPTAPPASAPATSAPLDAQAASDRAKAGAAWDTIKDVNDDAGRAIADVAMLVPRGLAGAYDSAVVRPMRAAGVNASYLSPSLVPSGVDTASMTPFTDQKRMQESVGLPEPAAPGPAASTAVARTGPAPAAPATTATPTATPVAAAASDPSRPGSHEYGPPNLTALAQPAASQVMPGVYRKGNSYGDSEQAALAGAQPRGFVSDQSMGAANNLAAQQQTESMQRVQAAMAPPPTSAIQRVAIMGSGDARGFRRASHLRAADRGDQARLQEAQRYDNRLGLATGQQQLERDRIAADTFRTARGFDAAQQRLDTERRTADSEITVRGLKSRALLQEEQLRNTFLDPNSTPEQRQQAQQSLRAISGGAEQSPWKVTVTPSTKNADGSTTQGSVIRHNAVTGEVQQVDGGGGVGLPSGMTKQVGTSNGKPVYEDASGRRFIGA